MPAQQRGRRIKVHFLVSVIPIAAQPRLRIYTSCHSTATSAHGEWVIAKLCLIYVLKVCAIRHILLVFVICDLDFLLLLGLADRHVPEFSFKLFHVIIFLFLLFLQIGELVGTFCGSFALALFWTDTASMYTEQEEICVLVMVNNVYVNVCAPNLSAIPSSFSFS
jgi:hypothetical protein